MSEVLLYSISRLQTSVSYPLTGLPNLWDEPPPRDRNVRGSLGTSPMYS